MTSRVRNDQAILALEVLAPGIGPIGVASRASMEQQQRRSRASKLIEEVEAVGRNRRLACVLRHSTEDEQPVTYI